MLTTLTVVIRNCTTLITIELRTVKFLTLMLEETSTKFPKRSKKRFSMLKRKVMEECAPTNITKESMILFNKTFLEMKLL